MIGSDYGWGVLATVVPCGNDVHRIEHTLLLDRPQAEDIAQSWVEVTADLAVLHDAALCALALEAVSVPAGAVLSLRASLSAGKILLACWPV